MNALMLQMLRVTSSTSLKLHDLICNARRFYKQGDPGKCISRMLDAKAQHDMLGTLIEKMIKDVESGRF